LPDRIRVDCLLADGQLAAPQPGAGRRLHVKRMETRNGPFLLSDDPARLDLDAICDFLSQTYWARHRSRELVEKSVRHSVCVGLYHEGRQVGFARAITDRATFAYLADVYVREAYRRRGLARWMVQSLLTHPELKGLRRWCLVTADAQALYRPFGFAGPPRPEEYMELLRPHPTPGATPTPAAPRANANAGTVSPNDTPGAPS